jgi:hypothetical protein
MASRLISEKTGLAVKQPFLPGNRTHQGRAII